MRRNKYGAKKTAILFRGDLIKFDSKAESLRAIELQRLEMAGVITGLELQPEYVLQEKFTSSRGKKIRPIVYRADFRYIENGVIIVEDVKGMKTDVFMMKMKLFLNTYKCTLRITKLNKNNFDATDY